MESEKGPRISIIAAIGRNRELGKGNDLIWRISADLKRVKALTTGHPIIMGRKTYESIGHPLPNRTNIVVSQSVREIEGCVVASTLHEAILKAKEIDQEEIFIFGGASMYEASMLFTNRLYLTIIDADAFDADVYFPAYEDTFTHVLEQEDHFEHNPPYAWVTLERPE
jgi:dihydrofolate reductase